MKGLLLKDWYMMKMYCKSYHFIAVVFVALSLVSNGNMFFVFYPCLLCGMIPVNLLGYDERSRWMQYSGTMPFTKIRDGEESIAQTLKNDYDYALKNWDRWEETVK